MILIRVAVLAALLHPGTSSSPFSLEVAVDEGLCTWCEAGDATCDWTFSDFRQGVFPTSASAGVEGRGFPYFRPSSQPPLEQGSPTATLAVVVHHGAARNGQDYTSYMTNAVLRAGLSLDDVLVIGPQIYEPGDEGLDEAAHIWWEASSDDGTDPDGGERDWKWGGNSTDELPVSISTFQVLDEILGALGDSTRYPRITRVIFAGHSAGGQIMQRYALFSRAAPLTPSVAVSYFAANPSSVTYLGPERPVQAMTKDCADFCVNTTLATQVWDFAVPGTNGSAPVDCPETYDQYGYGNVNFKKEHRRRDVSLLLLALFFNAPHSTAHA